MASLPGVAVVTGAGGTGIGAAVCKGFVRSGCVQIAITDINPDTLNQTKAALLAINPSAEIIVRVGDIADESFVDSFMNEVFDQFHRLDYGVNCAGILGGDVIKAVEMTTEHFDRLNNINYRGSWLSCRAQLRNMLKQEPLKEHPKQRGAIVNIASQLGIVARPGAAAYCASKAAIINMTRANAIDYSDDGIRVNCVCPGVIETPMTTTSPAMVEALKPAIQIAPMKRMGTPDEVADAVLFLCSAQSSFIQGHALVVDGGYTIN
ncbi:FabG Dehydrogenase with different specificities related to short-chain alcohol dehydrogenase [Pyrenophora tritici-repentis]|uniref:Bacilysin biosynthesis oxidoreductase bacC n=2 Tax=Pyrenophora tritici-repentis TaxID=45151 RepID=A0A2W1ERZ3_9PLEO|nr:bacilysin biosynthesis oxidoreductase bacC [Pyrenophora tritici-repentis Pt-1C-BFP]KAA8623521.1 Bacilysin biosynthesis oxidoreductase bacC [Pyrenophora tritici-repentis]EDU44966.1 bacilysin biosynthesis oxidoreductase bacC [Pyrenophora tritici-repentis Pt-1C-BFP]KAF7452528.1 Bacilysin biosynthesis oxidoreductase bacC [Pyrenophora tritici-repentis]KAF7574339.1 FabG, Dehydrogenase with different specificities (related to short-chain alcohol dehydrogenase) [Pyrenophora tritici-repentis]KAG9386